MVLKLSSYVAKPVPLTLNGQFFQIFAPHTRATGRFLILFSAILSVTRGVGLPHSPLAFPFPHLITLGISSPLQKSIISKKCVKMDVETTVVRWML